MTGTEELLEKSLRDTRRTQAMRRKQRSILLPGVPAHRGNLVVSSGYGATRKERRMNLLHTPIDRT